VILPICGTHPKELSTEPITQSESIKVNQNKLNMFKILLREFTDEYDVVNTGELSVKVDNLLKETNESWTRQDCIEHLESVVDKLSDVWGDSISQGDSADITNHYRNEYKDMERFLNYFRLNKDNIRIFGYLEDMEDSLKNLIDVKFFDFLRKG
jgi:hypothetical protein